MEWSKLDIILSEFICLILYFLLFHFSDFAFSVVTCPDFPFELFRLRLVLRIRMFALFHLYMFHIQTLFVYFVGTPLTIKKQRVFMSNPGAPAGVFAKFVSTRAPPIAAATPNGAEETIVGRNKPSDV